MPPNSNCRLPLISCGRPAMSGLARSAKRSSSGSTLYLTASISHSRCSSCSFCGFAFARSFAWVQSVFVSYSSQTSSSKAGSCTCPVSHGVRCSRDRRPALVVDAAVAEHLEVLRLVPLGRLGVVERVRHADAFDRPLLDAVDEERLGQTRRLPEWSARRRSHDGTGCGSLPCL